MYFVPCQVFAAFWSSFSNRQVWEGSSSDLKSEVGEGGCYNLYLIVNKILGHYFYCSGELGFTQELAMQLQALVFSLLM